MIDLVFAILYHTLLGLALAALVWGVGAGCVRGRGDSLDGYPFGLILVIAAAFLFLLTPWLGIPALLLLAPIVRARPRVHTATVGWAAPAVIGLPVVFGLMLHGPTRTLASAANGENLWWANRIWSAAASIVPYREPSGWSGSPVGIRRLPIVGRADVLRASRGALGRRRPRPVADKGDRARTSDHGACGRPLREVPAVAFIPLPDRDLRRRGA